MLLCSISAALIAASSMYGVNMAIHSTCTVQSLPHAGIQLQICMLVVRRRTVHLRHSVRVSSERLSSHVECTEACTRTSTEPD